MVPKREQMKTLGYNIAAQRQTVCLSRATRETAVLPFVLTLAALFIAGPATAQPPAPVPSRAVLYEEELSNPNGRQSVGSVVWSTEPIKGAGLPDDIAVHADIEIPDRKFKMALSLRRNRDKSLPASHTVELTFYLPQNFAGGAIRNVPGILAKSNEQAHGEPLAGLGIKVSDGLFLVGLSDVAVDRARNQQALLERAWLSIPLVYANQRRAILTVEKGAVGEQAFKTAFTAWGQYPVASGTGGYVVQVSSQRSEEDALASYKVLQEKFPDLLGPRSPLIKRADLGAARVYYRAMVGPFQSSEEASQFCGNLRTAGGQCIVQRN
jgi:sporulation related protein